MVERCVRDTEVAPIVTKCLAAGLLTTDYFTAVILLILLISSIITTIILKLLDIKAEKK